ncbi:unnamed protein product [Ectocarpus fasciculatus]
MAYASMVLLFLANMSRMAAAVLLPYKLHVSRSAAGVSLKMQELYLLVFSTRCLGWLLHSPIHSLYHMLIVATDIIPTALTVGMLKYRPCLKASYDPSLDCFRVWMHGIFPSFVLAVIVYTWHLTQPYYVSGATHFAWIFSEVLEPLAVVPQLLVSRGSTDAGQLGWTYVILMGIYPPLCVLSWVDTGRHYHFRAHYPFFYAAGIVQTGMYLMFLVTRRVRASPHSPPDETGPVDTMDSTSSARDRLLRDQDSDTDSSPNRERGLDGELRGESSRKAV